MNEINEIETWTDLKLNFAIVFSGNIQDFQAVKNFIGKERPGAMVLYQTKSLGRIFIKKEERRNEDEQTD